MPAPEDDGRRIDCGDDDAPCRPPAWIDDVAYAASVRLLSRRRRGEPNAGPLAVRRLRLFLGLLERERLPSPMVYLSGPRVVVEWGGAVGVAFDGVPGPILPKSLRRTLPKLRKALEEIYPRRPVPRGGEL